MGHISLGRMWRRVYWRKSLVRGLLPGCLLRVDGPRCVDPTLLQQHFMVATVRTPLVRSTKTNLIDAPVRRPVPLGDLQANRLPGEGYAAPCGLDSALGEMNGQCAFRF